MSPFISQDNFASEYNLNFHSSGFSPRSEIDFLNWRFNQSVHNKTFIF